MLENCGISDLENLSKNRKKLLELHNTTDVRDPVNLARNYFIFTEILNVDLDTNLSVLAQLTHTSSLDLDEDSSCVNICLDDQRLKAFPLGLNLRLLHAIGFTQEEIKILLFHPDMSSKLNTSLLVDFNQLVGEKFGGDIAAFCETLRRRLEIIRGEGQNLGVDNIFDMYKFLVNWEEAMAALDRAAREQSDVSLLLNFQDTMLSGFRNSCRVSLQTQPTWSGVADVNVA